MTSPTGNVFDTTNVHTAFSTNINHIFLKVHVPWQQKILRWLHLLADQQKILTVSPQRTFFQPFNLTLPGTNICWIQCSWNMKPVFTVNFLPNFLDLVLHPNLPLAMHLPYSPQYNFRIRSTEHSNNPSLNFHRSFLRCNQLA